MSFDCSNLKPGDRVWYGKTRYPDSRKIKSVEKVTPTQIVIRVNDGYLKRHRKDSGHVIGQAGWTPDYILGVPTREECIAYDAKEAREAAECARKEQIEADRKGKRDVLQRLFSDWAWVSEESWGEEADRQGKWAVSLHNLNEESVRELARVLACTLQKAG